MGRSSYTISVPSLGFNLKNSPRRPINLMAVIGAPKFVSNPRTILETFVNFD